MRLKIVVMRNKVAITGTFFFLLEAETGFHRVLLFTSNTKDYSLMNSSSKHQLSWIINISIKVSFLYYSDVRKEAKGTQNKTFIDDQCIHKQVSQSCAVNFQ